VIFEIGCVFFLFFTLILSPISLKSQQQAYIPKQGDVIRMKGDAKIYIIQNDQRRCIATQEMFREMGLSWDKVIELDPEEVMRIPEGPPIWSSKEIIASFPDGSLIRLKGKTQTYVIQGGRKCYIPDPETFHTMGYRWDQVMEVDQATFDSILTGIPIPSIKPSFQYAPSQKTCTDKVQFISDVTIPYNTLIKPGQSFVKTWRIKNTGTCQWESGYSLVFIGGSQMSAPDSIPIPIIPQNGIVDIGMSMVAPSTPGSYQGQWQMRNHIGQLFGNLLWVRVVARW
jgi:hypothetical protein